jgi:hypothetical protein
MGLYDTIKVELQLPGYSFITDAEFQTKSFDNVMENYVITKNNEIYREKWQYEWIDITDNFLGGRLKKIEDSYRREYLTDLHGDIIFYNGDVIGGKRYNYFARFSYGRLDQIWSREWDRW